MQEEVAGWTGEKSCPCRQPPIKVGATAGWGVGNSGSWERVPGWIGLDGIESIRMDWMQSGMSDVG